MNDAELLAAITEAAEPIKYHGYSATYDPADNKLRLRAVSRLPKDLYERVRAEGFIWAPKQDFFVAPAWTPSREDLLLELCGEIDDEDTSLVERAEQRADRFETYSTNRADDAHQAREAVSAIADNIPLGQPILVGHHSERRARKDAEKIENGMRKAIKLWDQSQYWQDRAAGALRHAKYLERPDVRQRRIKKLEAEKRKVERNKATAEKCLRFWSGRFAITNHSTGEKRPFEISEANRENIVKVIGNDPDFGWLNLPRKEGDKPDFDQKPSAYSALSNSYPNLYAPRTVAEAQAAAMQAYPREIAHWDRWIAHYTNRLAYEQAMLAESGGTAADKFNIVIGGQVKRRGGWFVVTKVNRVGTAINSVSVIGHWASTITVDEIQDYRPPKEGDWEKVKAVTAKAPLCNYPGKGIIVSRFRYGTEDDKPCDCVHITQAQWDDQGSDYKATRDVAATATVGRHRVRYGMFAGHKYVPVYIMDAKRKDPPPAERGEEKPTLPERHEDDPQPAYKPEPKPAEADQFNALRDTLKAGVKVVSAPNLFPTPPDLARRMVDLAEVRPGMRVLEPSAGTGSIVEAIINRGFLGLECGGKVVAVEINQSLAEGLRERRQRTLYANESNYDVRCADFLGCDGDLGQFDRVLMNPPFDHGSDIQHIQHALTMLKPGGRLVAICANGPKQQRELQPICDQWMDLEPGTFKEQGTNVNTALIVIQRGS